MPLKSILNVRLVAAVGPSLASGISLAEPASVAVNDIGEIFVSDKAANAIYKFSTTLELMVKEGSPSSGEFNRPLGLATDAALNVYIADGGNKRIQVLDRNLRFARSVSSYFDQNGESADFIKPNDISIDGEGNFWIGDDERVLKLDPFFNLILEISNNAPGPFIVGKVSSVRAGRGNLAAIADFGNQRIAVVSTAGNYVSEISVPSPKAVTWDIAGNIWVIDAQGVLSAFDIYGTPLYSFSGDIPGSKYIWAAFDPGGRLVLLDGGLRKLDIFEVITGSMSTGGK